MFRKALNSKFIISKTFFFYLGIYFCALILRHSKIIDFFLIDIEYYYLILINIASISLGLPLSIIFDLLLIKLLGVIYILFFAPIVTLLGLMQIIFMRKTNFNLQKKEFFKQYITNSQIYNIFKRVTLNPIFVFILRSLPILPFVLSSYIIASSKVNKKLILRYSLIGTYFYYFSIYLIIKIT